MIDPAAVDFFVLPSAPIRYRRAPVLPAVTGIYAAIDGYGLIQYIGKSVNIGGRWKSHDKRGHLWQMEDVRIAYLECEKEELHTLEKALIQRFDPPLNTGMTERAKKPKRESMPLQMNRDLYKELERCADKRGSSMKRLARIAILEYLQREGYAKGIYTY